MLEGKSREKSIRAFLLTLLGLSFGAFMYSYDMKMENYNSTILAFSYKYGFISRGLVGTCYQFLDKLLPGNQMTYQASVNITLIVTICFYLFVFLFMRYCIKKVSNENLKNIEVLEVILMIAIVTMFAHKRNFGRIDMFMLLVSLVAVWLIMADRCLWLVPILSIVGVMVHQGYDFMYANLVLVLLVYKIFENYNTDKTLDKNVEDSTGIKFEIGNCFKGSARRYSVCLLFTFVAISVFLIYFEFFSHVNGQAIVKDVIANANSLARSGKYHKTLVEHEILGKDITKEEWPMHVENWIEIPFFFLLSSPFIALGIRFWKNIFVTCIDKLEKIKYIVVLIGPVTLLPLYIAKVDYGRWDFALLMYCGFIVLVLSAMGDQKILGSLNEVIIHVRTKYPYSWILLLYAIVFMPFWDVHVCSLLRAFSNPINDNWLNLW